MNNSETPAPPKQKQCHSEYDRKLSVAFRTDCEEFLEHFEKVQSLKFSEFAKIWQIKNFTYVFAGQRYALCLKNFCEDVFYIVKKFIMFPKNLFTQIGAFYMLYGLYYKQPLQQWIKIRLTLEECQKITVLVDEVKTQGVLDAAYIFLKMKLEAAFLYVALRKPLGPEDRFVKTFESYYNDTFGSSKVNETVSKFHNINSSELVQELKKTNTEYENLLKKYSKTVSGSNLMTFTSTIVQDIQDACTNFKEGKGRVYKQEDSTVLMLKRRSIKNKAMANKNAVYRGSKQVKTAQDEDVLKLINKGIFKNDSDENIDDDNDDDYDHDYDISEDNDGGGNENDYKNENI